MASKPTPTFIHRGFQGETTCCALIPGDVLVVGTTLGKCVAFSASTHIEISVLFEDEEKRAITNCGTLGDEFFIHVRASAVLVGSIEENRFVLRKSIRSDHFGFCRAVACGAALIVPDYTMEMHYFRVITGDNDVRIGPLNARKADSKDPNVPAPMSVVFLSEDCSLVAVGMEDGVIQVHEVRKPGLCSSLSASSETIFDLSFDFRTRMLAVASVKSQIKLFQCDLDGYLKLTREIEYPEWSKGCSSLSFSPGGKLLVAGFWNGFARIYSMKTGKMLCSIDYHEHTITSVAWLSRSEETPLYLCSQDGKLTIWNVYNDRKA